MAASVSRDRRFLIKFNLIVIELQFSDISVSCENLCRKNSFYVYYELYEMDTKTIITMILKYK